MQCFSVHPDMPDKPANHVSFEANTGTSLELKDLVVDANYTCTVLYFKVLTLFM